jgi:putative transposase
MRFELTTLTLAKQKSRPKEPRNGAQSCSAPRLVPHLNGESVIEGEDDAQIEIHGRTDHRDPGGAGARHCEAEVCRKHGVSSATFYKWKAKYGGMDVSDARKLKTLESENARLKKLLADAMLDNAVLKDLLGNS